LRFFPLPRVQGSAIRSAKRELETVSATHRFWAWYFLDNNFCRIHMSLRTTPAAEAGVADRVWSVEKLLDELATQ
jgi:hypothetical protein